jgi:hypothetical protein
MNGERDFIKLSTEGRKEKTSVYNIRPFEMINWDQNRSKSKSLGISFPRAEQMKPTSKSHSHMDKLRYALHERRTPEELPDTSARNWVVCQWRRT